MDAWTIAVAVIGVIIIFVLFYLLRIRRTLKRVVVRALVDIHGSGSHHVEFIPSEGVHPVDLVQLAISYLANMIFLTVQDSPQLKADLIKLADLVTKHDGLTDIPQYRQELKELAKSPSDSLLSTGRHATGKSERYEVRLIRGRNLDYSISEFAMYSYKPNLTTSAVLLYNAVANRLDDSYLFLLHKSLIGLVGYFHEAETPTMGNNQHAAFNVVDYCLKVCPGPLENSQGRVRRLL